MNKMVFAVNSNFLSFAILGYTHWFGVINLHVTQKCIISLWDVQNLNDPIIYNNSMADIFLFTGIYLEMATNIPLFKYLGDIFYYFQSKSFKTILKFCMFDLRQVPTIFNVKYLFAPCGH